MSELGPVTVEDLAGIFSHFRAHDTRVRLENDFVTALERLVDVLQALTSRPDIMALCGPRERKAIIKAGAFTDAMINSYAPHIKLERS